MTARSVATIASLALLTFASACTNFFEVPIETPLSPKMDVSAFRRVLVAGFISGGTDDVDANLETVRLLRTRMYLSSEDLALVFQSRFGRAEWLKPYAAEVVAAAPAKGVKNLVMVMPGFAADCVETLEEVAIGLRETFHENGGQNFSTVPCLNASAESIAMLTAIARRELRGWI